MRWRSRFGRLAAALVLLGSFATCVARGQDAGNLSNARIFPQIGPDLQAIKRDSSGRYYILAKPASVIWVYGADGQLIGRIPNGHSGGVAIRYAVDIDVDSAGDLYVADRGANAIEIFRPDGSLINKVSVFAPVSVVALPDGQFAVASLRSKHLVSIYDQSGSLYHEFGDRSEIDSGVAPDALFNPGKICGDSQGHIYFAFTSLPDPMVRKYDDEGYMDFAASLPVGEIVAAASKPEDRLEFGLNVGQMNFSDQIGAWATIGSSGTLRFGSSMGTGFGERMRGGFVGRSGVGAPGGFGNPFGAMASNTAEQPAGAGPNGATFFGQGMLQNGHFHFDLGAGLGRGRSGRGAAAGSDGSTDSDLGQASLLQFSAAGLSDGSGAGDGSSSSIDDADAQILDTDTSSELSSPDAALGTDQADPAFQLPLADDFLQPQMFAGGALFRPHGGGFGGGRGGGAFGGKGFGGARFTPGAAGGGTASSATGPDGRPGFGSPGHFVFNTFNVAASVRLNLDRPAQTHEDKPTLTAVGVDPATGESWVAIGSQLIHLGKDGALLGSYYVATPEGTPLHPVAILVEPNRLLLADDPLGIFSFARPDRTSAAPKANVAAEATGARGSH